MKSSIALLLLIIGIFAYAQSAAAADEAKARDTCSKADATLTADELRIISENKPISKVENPSKALKCYVKCFYKEVGAIGADKKPNPEAVIQHVELLTGVKDKLRITASLASCGNEKGTDECDSIYKFEKCVLKDMGV